MEGGIRGRSFYNGLERMIGRERLGDVRSTSKGARGRPEIEQFKGESFSIGGPFRMILSVLRECSLTDPIRRKKRKGFER